MKLNPNKYYQDTKTTAMIPSAISQLKIYSYTLNLNKIGQLAKIKGIERLVKQVNPNNYYNDTKSHRPFLGLKRS